MTSVPRVVSNDSSLHAYATIEIFFHQSIIFGVLWGLEAPKIDLFQIMD